jgi:hypothetical protein
MLDPQVQSRARLSAAAGAERGAAPAFLARFLNDAYAIVLIMSIQRIGKNVQRVVVERRAAQS